MKDDMDLKLGVQQKDAIKNTADKFETYLDF